MASVGLAIYDILSNDAGVSALVSDRIYPMVAPQDAADPLIVWSVVSRIPSDTKGSYGDLDTLRIEFNSYAITYPIVESIDDAIRTALDRIAHGAYATVTLDGVSYENSMESFDEELRLFNITTDYFFRVKY